MFKLMVGQEYGTLTIRMDTLAAALKDSQSRAPTIETSIVDFQYILYHSTEYWLHNSHFMGLKI